VTAVAGTAIVVSTGLVWWPINTGNSSRPAIETVPPLPPASFSPPVAASAALVMPTAKVEPPQQEAANQAVAAAPEVPKPAVAPPAAVQSTNLSFDVVRVQPTGEAVVAGRGDPGSDVSLIDHGAVVAQMTIDASGQFAILPPALAEGEHVLTLQSVRSGQAPVVSAQSVAVSVAKGATAKPMVALLSPDQPTRVLSDGAPLVPSSGSASNATPVPVSIQSVEAGEGGQFTASGVARAGSQCRLYLNGAFLADVTAGKDGRWSVKVEHGMQPGKYTVRADELEAASGKVLNRAEVPFDYPAKIAAGAAKRLLLSKATSAASKPATASLQKASASPNLAAAAMKQAAALPQIPAGPGISLVEGSSASDAKVASAVVSQVQSTKVIRGDTLWRISRKMLGRGMSYTEIYASNTAQIRDPNRIYPGQIFVLPNRATN
jgi:nucleoid-associated protein YgaU